MQATAQQMEMRANEAARKHMGDVAWPTVIFGIACAAGYGATLVLAGFAFIPSFASFALIAVLVYASYTILHEAVHGSINGKQRSLLWLNNLMGYLSAQLFGVAFTVHRKEHLAHHRNTNAPGEDPDLLLVTGGAMGLVRGVLIALPMQLKYYLKYHWRDAGRRERSVLIIEYAIMIAWRVLFVIFAGWQAALLLLVGATLAGFLILLLSFAWVVHRSFDVVGRYKDTSTIIFPKPFDTIITLLWLFQNYHSIHHLFPRVPFYRYRQLFTEIEDVMQANGAPILRIGEGRDKPLLASISA